MRSPLPPVDAPQQGDMRLPQGEAEPQLGWEQDDEQQQVQDDPPDGLELSRIDDIRIVQLFIHELRQPSLFNGDLSLEDVERILSPPTHPLSLDSFSENPDALKMCLKIYLAHLNSSERAYNDTISAIRETHPEDGDLPSYARMERIIAELTGIHPIRNDMCENSCMRYTGPFSELTECLKCQTPRFDTSKKPKQQFTTIPIGPVLQAFHRDRETAEKLTYLENKLRSLFAELDMTSKISEYSDVLCGQEILQAVAKGIIDPETDTLLMYSIDGAQLYRSKQSDCWISIWVVLNLSPDGRYKKMFIIPDKIIPGPHPPKIVESFLYPTLHHVAAINEHTHEDGNRGLLIWDAFKNAMFYSKLFIALATADGPGMTYLNGLVGHKGKSGCRVFCSFPGRRRERARIYYPAFLKANGPPVRGADHADISFTTLRAMDSAGYDRALAKACQSTSNAEFERQRLASGICKPSLFSDYKKILFLVFLRCSQAISCTSSSILVIFSSTSIRRI
jgi:hypothetical protein